MLCHDAHILYVHVACVLQHLDLELSEGFELWLDAGDELSALRNLRSLTVSGRAGRPDPVASACYLSMQTLADSASGAVKSSGV